MDVVIRIKFQTRFGVYETLKINRDLIAEGSGTTESVIRLKNLNILDPEII